MSSDSAPPPAILEYLPYLPEEPAIWLVGGIPRDQLLGRVSRDFDFVVAGEARALARRFADQLGAAYYALDRERDIGRVILTGGEKDRITFDFARLRGTTIEDDLRDRDFTINAIAVRLSAPYTWIDPLGGARDVKEKVVKACSSHSLADDPVRALRAIRFALSFGFQIADETREGIVRVKGTLGSVSFERIRDELMQICRMPHPGKAFRLLDYMGILDSLFPDVVLSTCSGCKFRSVITENRPQPTGRHVCQFSDFVNVFGFQAPSRFRADPPELLGVECV
ncbi:MAG: hypothetical protein P8Z41_00555 [Anaerolineales bacterium]